MSVRPGDPYLAATSTRARTAEVITPKWGAVASLALGVFGMVTAEFLPATLLTPMASDLGISNGTAGQAVTATALVAAVAAPAIVLGTAKLDRGRVIWGLSLLLVSSNVGAAFAPNIWALIAARAGVGIALGGVWALAAAVAMRLVPARLLPRAITLIFGGIAAATVCAPALGAYLGDLWGWRMTFLAAAGLGVAALVAQVATLPPLAPTAAPTFATFYLLLRRPRIRIGIITVLLAFSGHFAGYTYMRPFLEQVTRLDIQAIALALLVFGISGVIGNAAGGFAAGCSVILELGSASLLLAAARLALATYGAFTPVAYAAVAVWGFAFGALPVGTQVWTTQSAPDHAEGAVADVVEIDWRRSLRFVQRTTTGVATPAETTPWNRIAQRPKRTARRCLQGRPGLTRSRRASGIGCAGSLRS